MFLMNNLKAKKSVVFALVGVFSLQSMASTEVAMAPICRNATINQNQSVEDADYQLIRNFFKDDLAKSEQSIKAFETALNNCKSIMIAQITRRRPMFFEMNIKK
jgi:hypothetical protein